MKIDKSIVRQTALALRDSIDDETRKIWDEQIFSTVISSNYYKQAKVIFTYVNFKSEVNTKNLIKKALCDRKQVCVPKVVSRREGMKLYYITSLDQLEASRYGILEPFGNLQEVSSDVVDMAIIPGLAFDKNGGRLGYGAGFYDRFLGERQNILKVALAYELQLLESVPCDVHDALMDLIVTNKMLIDCTAWQKA